MMLSGYFIIAFRSFRKQKFFTALNILGLSLGMACSMLIFQYVRYERSFDRFHSNADNIYRVDHHNSSHGVSRFRTAVSVPAVARELKSNFPEVVAYTRFFRTGGVIAYEKPGGQPVLFREDRAYFADTSLFTVFDFKLVKGNDRECLNGINKIIISNAIASRYFAGEDPVGKMVSISDRDGEHRPAEITGVFADVPENSHIKFDFLVSYETLNAWADNLPETSWDWNSFYTFVSLKPGTDVEALQAKWNQHLEKVRGEEWKKQNFKEAFLLTPLTDIHLFSNVQQENLSRESRDAKAVYALALIGLFIAVIAWINYVNMATSRSLKRANEVGVRKVVGALRSQLVLQFLAENFIVNMLALALALLLTKLFWRPFSALTGWNIPLSLMQDGKFWVFISMLLAAGVLLSGFYPAFVLSSFKPVKALKGEVIHPGSGNYLRKALVVFQFSAAVFLISGSLIVYHQLMFMRNKDLGVDIRETLVLKGPLGTVDPDGKKFDAFKLEMMGLSGVKNITASSGVPGLENYWKSETRRINTNPRSNTVVMALLIDTEYVIQYAIGVRAGRNFSSAFNDENNVLINEELARVLQFERPEDAIGEKITHQDDTLSIVGVLSDYHQLSLRSPVVPHLFKFSNSARFYSIKIETGNYAELMATISNAWSRFFPDDPISYFFLDEFFNQQYEGDNRFGKVFALFTLLAIIIASIGLIGLASVMTIQRTKEIGIRKVLGATVPGVVLLLSKQFLQLVFFAIVTGVPLVWVIMRIWLESFPYHTSIDPAVFIISAITVTLVAFIAVSSQTLRASLTRPSETLKHNG